MKKMIERVITVIALSFIMMGICFSCYTYVTRNLALRKSSAGKVKIKIACVGDSITYGSGVLSTRKKDSYPAQLERLLGEDYIVQNYGIGGRTLQNEGDKPYRRENLFEKSQVGLPDVVLIMLGTNDSKPYNWNAKEYTKQLQDFVGVYKGLKNGPEVYLMTCCAAFCVAGKDEVAYHIDGTVIVSEINEIIRQVGILCNVPVIDIYSVTQNHPEYFTDGVHPNAVGNKVIAQTIYTSINANAVGNP